MAKIAVVDDDAHLRKLLTTLLTRRKHQPVAFPNGAEALLEIRKGEYDLVLSDVQMPQLDGISLCKALRESFSKAQLPIMLLSVLDKEDDILRAMEAGASDYLVKPYSLSLLQAKIGIQLQQRQKESTDRETTRLPRPKILLGEPVKLPHPFDLYELIKPIGRGGYAVVYRARRLMDGEILALKLLDREINHNRESLSRYFREVALLSRVNSPHVVRILDSGYDQGRYYLAMELVEGEAADTLLSIRGPLPVRVALRIGNQISQAIAALGEQGLIHRDIKPSNIIVRPDQQVTLVDFGLAKMRSDQGLTSPDDIMGTPDYIAPEVLHGEREHVGSDVYSLGITLNELLVGEPPFPGNTPYEILVNVASGLPAPDVHLLRRDVPEDVSMLVARLTAPDPRNRINNPLRAQEAFQALQDKYGG